MLDVDAGISVVRNDELLGGNCTLENQPESVEECGQMLGRSSLLKDQVKHCYYWPLISGHDEARGSFHSFHSVWIPSTDFDRQGHLPERE